MGAVTFSLDIRLVNVLKSVLPLNEFIETGTFKGDAAAEMGLLFDRVVTIELSEALAADAVNRFNENPKILVLQGNSADKLHELRPDLERISALYWLDAHWCVADDTAGELSQCPLMNELKAIGHLNDKSVILIDDARLFLAPPLLPHEISQWPRFHQIVMFLLTMSPDHELMVVNDVIVFFPSPVRHAMESYAQSYGLDWLDASNCLKENASFMQQLVDKESVIQQQSFDLARSQPDHVRLQADHVRLQADHVRLQVALAESMMVQIEKEEVIRALARSVVAYRVVYTAVRPLAFLLSPFAVIVRHGRAMLRPRLGNLNQHPPIDLIHAPVHHHIAGLSATPKISIVTPSFKQGAFIEETLLSVIDQQYPNLEYFVQDGASDDGTVDVLKLYEGRITGWESKPDGGQSQAINAGFARTSGEIMAWLNSDDLLLPGALATVIEYFNRHPEVDVVYGDRLLIDENGMQIGRWIMPGHDSAVLSWVDYVPQETMFWRRRIWDQVGGHIDESFRFAMDWDLLIRFRDVGAKFKHIPQFLGAFRIHQHQKTSTAIDDVGAQEMSRIRRRVLGYLPGSTDIRKHVFWYLLKHVAVELAHRVKLRLRALV
jgi:glycosyltransferase involved in cell wall biosynthesis